MIYKRRAEYVHAEVFKMGMEDGMLDGNRYIPKDANTYPEGSRSEKHEGYLRCYDNDIDEGYYKPYIMVYSIQVIVELGDYIVTSKTYCKSVYKPEDFHTEFELSEDEIKRIRAEKVRVSMMDKVEVVEKMSPARAIEVLKSNYPSSNFTMLREAVDLSIIALTEYEKLCQATKGTTTSFEITNTEVVDNG